MYAITLIIILLHLGHAISSPLPTLCYLSTQPSPHFKLMNNIVSQSKNSDLTVNVKEFITSKENLEKEIKEMAKDQKCDGLVMTDSNFKAEDFKILICDPEIEDFFSKINAVWVQNNENVDFLFPNASFFGLELEVGEPNLKTELLIPLMIGNLSKEKFESFINPTKKLTQKKLDHFITILIELISRRSDPDSKLKLILGFLSSKDHLITGNLNCDINEKLIEKSWLEISNKKSQKYVSLKGSTPLHAGPLLFHSDSNWKLSTRLECLKGNKISTDALVSTIKTFLDEEKLDFKSLELILESLELIKKNDPKESLQVRSFLLGSNYFNRKFLNYLEDENASLVLAEVYLKQLVNSNSKFTHLAQDEFKKNIINHLKNDFKDEIDDQQFNTWIKLLSQNELLDSLVLDKIKRFVNKDNSQSISLFIEAITQSSDLKEKLFQTMESLKSTHTLSVKNQEKLYKIRKELICYGTPKKGDRPNSSYLHLQFTEIFESEFCQEDQVVTEEMAKTAFKRILDFINSSPQITGSDLEVIIKQINNFKNYYPNNKTKIEADFFLNLLKHPQANSNDLSLILKRLLSHTDNINEENFWIMSEEGDIFREKLTKALLQKDFIDYPNLKLIKSFYERTLRIQFIPPFPSSDKIKSKAIKNSLIHLKENPEETNLHFFSDLEFEFFELKNKKKLKDKYKLMTSLKDKVNFLLENI